MANKVSVITVVYNNVAHIRQTMESFFQQTWEDKEYIVIDGGSTDGTAEIIREYADRLAYWCSEKDNGIYDAMNKGLDHCTGDWVNFLNSGDYYCSDQALEQTLKTCDIENADVVYGNCIEADEFRYNRIPASDDWSAMEFAPVFRHGASLIRLSVHQKFPFDLSLSSKIGYALDWHMLYTLYKNGYRFKKADVFIETYRKEGASNHPIKNLWYNYLITSKGRRGKTRKLLFFLRSVTAVLLKGSKLYTWLRAFLIDYLVNSVLPTIPFWSIRKFYLKRIGMRIGKGTFIAKRNYFINPNLVKTGKYSHINRGCMIDGRATVTIGNNVSISHNVNLVTGSHEWNDPHFLGVFLPIQIDDYAWIGIGSTILQGVHIGKGAVVCAGAVVTKSVPPYTVVGGCPAKPIKERTHNLNYQCNGYSPLS